MTQEYNKNGVKEENYELFVPYEEIKIPVPWGHISGKWWGSKDQQPVLAIHGWQDNAGTFDNLAPLLANEFSILCIDLPGHGFSSHYPNGQYYYIFWDGILIIRRIVKHFKWNKVKLMGHSLGGAIAFLYAASYPNEIDSYISIDIASPSVRDTSQMVSSIGDNVDKFLKYENLSPETMPCYNKEQMYALVYDAHKDSISKENCEIMMKRGMKPINDSAYCFTRDVRLKVPVLAFMTMDQVLEFASRIKCNVMNIRGNPGMQWTNPQNYDIVLDKIQESARSMHRHIIPGTHHLHLNNAERVVNIIRDFLYIN